VKESPLRVVVVVSQFWPVIGGAEIQARRLASELLRQGLDVEVWTARLERAWPRAATLDGLRVRRFGSPWLLGRLFLRRIERYYFMLATFLALLRRRRCYDVVHVHQVLGAAAVAALAGRLAGRPVVARISSTGSTSDLLVSGRVQRALARRFLTRVVAVSAQAAEDCRRWGYRTEQVVHIPNGVRAPGFVPGRAEREKLEVLYLGGLRRVKRVDLAIEAWMSAGCRGRLTIAGEGPEGDRLRRLAQTASQPVRFLGRVEDPQPLLEGCDVFVLASDAEGMSNALLEAMACGRACIATYVGGNVDALGPELGAPPPPGRYAMGSAGLLVGVGDAAALAAGLQALARSPELRGSLGRAARERCLARFRIEAVAESYRRLYADLIGPPESTALTGVRPVRDPAEPGPGRPGDRSAGTPPPSA
jgi:glycosyltransferase involved in cell wall biosynthesis